MVVTRAVVAPAGLDFWWLWWWANGTRPFVVLALLWWRLPPCPLLTRTTWEEGGCVC